MAATSIGLDTGLVFTEALKNFLPASLLPLAVVLFFAGIMSSSDTSIYAISSHYALSKKNKSIKTVRTTSLLVVAVVTLIALFYSDIIDVTIIAGGISMTLSAAMIYIICKGKNSSRFIGSIVGASIGCILGIVYLEITPAILLPVLAGGLLGLLWKSKAS